MQTTFSEMFATQLQAWSVEKSGPMVTEAELAVAAGMLTKHGTGKHLGLAMCLRPGGATQNQVLVATGDTQVNVVRDVITEGKAIALPMPPSPEGHKVYLLAPVSAQQARRSPLDQLAMELTQRMAIEGHLLISGFAAYLLHNKIPLADHRIPAMLDLYMSGAEHLWSSVMTTLDAEHEVTDDDLKRMDGIEAEMEQWRTKKRAAFAEQYATKGKA